MFFCIHNKNNKTFRFLKIDIFKHNDIKSTIKITKQRASHSHYIHTHTYIPKNQAALPLASTTNPPLTPTSHN